jgi:hypothetical protein
MRLIPYVSVVVNVREEVVCPRSLGAMKARLDADIRSYRWTALAVAR